MIDVCAVCGQEVGDPDVGVGSMLFHLTCLPTCKFCERPYVVQEAGGTFGAGSPGTTSGATYRNLESAACPTCTDDAERRDYGAGW